MYNLESVAKNLFVFRIDEALTKIVYKFLYYARNNLVLFITECHTWFP